MHCALFQEFIEIIFKFSADLGVRNESTVKNGIFPCRRFETHFFILSRVQREEFHYKKAISCKSYVQPLIQDEYSNFIKKLVSYKCMLFVDCLVVLREYFVN